MEIKRHWVSNLVDRARKVLAHLFPKLCAFSQFKPKSKHHLVWEKETQASQTTSTHGAGEDCHGWWAFIVAIAWHICFSPPTSHLQQLHTLAYISSHCQLMLRHISNAPVHLIYIWRQWQASDTLLFAVLSPFSSTVEVAPKRKPAAAKKQTLTPAPATATVKDVEMAATEWLKDHSIYPVDSWPNSMDSKSMDTVFSERRCDECWIVNNLVWANGRRGSS